MLAAAGALGGISAKALPKITPKIEAGMTKAYGVMKTTGSEANESLKTALSGVLPKEPQLATAGGGRIDTLNIKPTNGKSAIEKLNEPLKIVSVDSKGNPSGTRFRSDYEAHIKSRDYSNSSQKGGVNGCHNVHELEKFDVAVNQTLTKNSINILNKTAHPTMKGIYNVEYQMPKMNSQLQVTGWRNLKGNQPFVKTVYDPKIISDKQMMQWGREAFADAMQKNPTISRTPNIKWEGTASNGLKFEGRVDTKGSEAVRTFYPKF